MFGAVITAARRPGGLHKTYEGEYMSEPKVYVYIDDSNIFISAKEAVARKEGDSEKYMARLQFDNLAKLAIADRSIGKIVVVGSIPPEEKQVWEKLEKGLGVKPELYERGSETGCEQGTDQCLQVHMLRAISDNKDPQIAVLLTGDGAGFDDGVGFHADLKRMHDAGWGIEVLSWSFSCKRALKVWAESVGEFIPLENYYDAITFIQDGRKSNQINLATRPKASIKKSPVQLAEDKVRAEMEKKIKELEKQVADEKDKGKHKDQKKEKYDRMMDKRKGNS